MGQGMKEGAHKKGKSLGPESLWNPGSKKLELTKPRTLGGGEVLSH